VSEIGGTAAYRPRQLIASSLRDQREVGLSPGCLLISPILPHAHFAAIGFTIGAMSIRDGKPLAHCRHGVSVPVRC